MQTVLFLCILLLAATEWGSIATGVGVINFMVGDQVYFPFSVQRDPTDDTQSIRIVFEPDYSSRTDTLYKYIFNPGLGMPHSANNRLSYDDENERVLMNNAAANDIGNYTISLVSSLHNTSENTVKFRLVVHAQPTLDLTVTDDTITLSNNLVNVATCVVTGTSGVEVSIANSNKLPFQETHIITKSDGFITHKLQLDIVPTEKYNGAKFHCIATYKVYLPYKVDEISTSQTVDLDVLYLPKDPIITVPNNKSSLTCSADGNPTPNVILKLDDEILAEGSSPQSIDVVSSEDPSIQENEYVCHAIIPDGGTISSEPLTISQLQEILMESTKTIEPAKTGMIVGIVFGSLILCGVIGGLVYWFRIRKKSVGDLTV